MQTCAVYVHTVHVAKYGWLVYSYCTVLWTVICIYPVQLPCFVELFKVVFFIKVFGVANDFFVMLNHVSVSGYVLLLLVCVHMIVHSCDA